MTNADPRVELLLLLVTVIVVVPVPLVLLVYSSTIEKSQTYVADPIFPSLLLTSHNTERIEWLLWRYCHATNFLICLDYSSILENT